MASRLVGPLPLPNGDNRMNAQLFALQAPASGSGSTFLIIQFILIIGIVYFLMIRP